MARALDVVVADGRGHRLRMTGLSRWLQQIAPWRARGSVSVALLSDARVRALNRRYRRIDHATDVLSFPAGPQLIMREWGPLSGGPIRLKPDATGHAVARGPFLGDIAIAKGIARRQARAAGHSELTELRVLALHGLLHLLGYDHEHDNGRMRRVEERLRRRGGLPAGLIERQRGKPLRNARRWATQSE
ncbi:MAG: rRNA maturation RNase YbeY [Vicinamibacterales bacterium]